MDKINGIMSKAVESASRYWNSEGGNRKLIPESCMKINENLGLCSMGKNHFISLLFTRWASRKLPSAALYAVREYFNSREDAP
jgi:hypothetical protein